MLSARIGIALVIGWVAGTIASTAGIFGSFLLDAPTGATTVVAFAVVLVLAGGVRAFITAPAKQRERNRRAGLLAGGLLLCAVFSLSGLWIVIAPAGDHPVLAALEIATGLGPEKFMSSRERTEYLDAAATERQNTAEVNRLYDLERRSRWQGEALTADEVRRIGSVQQH